MTDQPTSPSDPQTDARVSRREAFRRIGRIAAGGAIAAAAVILGRRSAHRPDGQTCINEGVCSGCSVFDDCGLPQALSARQAKAKRSPADPKG